MTDDHTLTYRGAPHRLAPDGRLVRDLYRTGSGGTGRAACRCGAYSVVLTSLSERKAWHHDHTRVSALDGGEHR